MAVTACSVSDVAALLRARTRSDASGSEAGTFDDTTRPTGEQVEGLIDQASRLVALKLGSPLADDLGQVAQHAVAIRTAMLVELSLQPDQTSDVDSVYMRLKVMFDELMADLKETIDAGGGSASNRPRFGTLMIGTPLTGAVLPDDELTDRWP